MTLLKLLFLIAVSPIIVVCGVVFGAFWGTVILFEEVRNVLFF